MPPGLPGTVASDQRQANLDISAGCVGVGAYLMGGFDQPLGQFSVQSRQADLQRDFQAETTRNLADPDVGGDGRFCRKRLLLLASDEFQGTDEAGRVACRKELLRVVALPP